MDVLAVVLVDQRLDQLVVVSIGEWTVETVHCSLDRNRFGELFWRRLRLSGGGGVSGGGCCSCGSLRRMSSWYGSSLGNGALFIGAGSWGFVDSLGFGRKCWCWGRS